MEKNNVESAAAVLYDGGWRAADKEQIMQEHGMTAEEAEAICTYLEQYEAAGTPEKIESLQELTGQESGIVIYGDEVIVTSWSSITGLPRMAPANLGIIGWPDEITVVKKYDVADIRDILPGTIVDVEGNDEDGIVIEAERMDIVEDHNGDIPALWGYDIGLTCNAIINRDEDGNLTPTAGTVYELTGDVIVIAPDGWC